MPNKATKPKKKKSIYSEKYIKGTYFNDLSQVKGFLEKKGIVVYAIQAEKYDDGTESVTIKIDNIGDD